MTRSGWVARISSVLAVHESCKICRWRVARDGRASMQYLVQAQRWSSLSSAARVRVIEGCREAMRITVSLVEDESKNVIRKRQLGWLTIRPVAWLCTRRGL